VQGDKQQLGGTMEPITFQATIEKANTKDGEMKLTILIPESEIKAQKEIIGLGGAVLVGVAMTVLAHGDES
jgi:hypothetical protein